MATNYSPNIVTDGLVFAVDPANVKSYNSGSAPTSTISLYDHVTSGSLTNGVAFGAGAWDFDGTDDYIDVNYPSGLFTRSSTITADIWVKNVEATPSSNSIMFYIGSADHGSQDHLLILGFRPDKTNYFHVSSDGGTDSGASSIISDTAFDLTQWNNIIIIKRGIPSGPGSISMYINGNDVTADDAGNNFLSGDDADKIALGGSIFASSLLLPYEGSQSLFKVYSGELSSTEIKQNYNALKGRFA